MGVIFHIHDTVCDNLEAYLCHYVSAKSGHYYEMSSFPETKVEKWTSKGRAKQLLNFNRLQFSRVYPKGQRIDSSNYDPIPMWNCGCQLAALNYQTPGNICSILL